ncbi:TRAP transporter substrate-binding protein [uncultured Ferrovibrio sp.]|jgi:TRAP-type C4-dicarboxylate transport system substrate-binding protein|uniref:TRAP transporter substrate-binding protein n=1 Tax=uncultured Ferrovibrio sp. TaxID=1576913 RepID=UPI00262689AF|nr:TRAP transporter substrate-binding protein [uncultured Ferrovibrio sp.]
MVYKKWLAAAALGGVLIAGGDALAQTKWDLPGAYPAGNFHTKNLVQFAEDVKKLSGGKLEITVHPGASLFKAPEIKRAVQTGQVQIGEVLMVNVENEIPVFGADGVPFLATSFDAAYKLWQAQKPVIEKKLAEQGMTALYAVAWPPQGIYAKKDINKVEDLKGTKWRAYSPATSRIAELVQAQPVTIQQAELAQALATGVVDTFMTSGSTGRDSKVWESLTHYYDTQAWLPKNLVFVNNDAFKKLDAATQKALKDAAVEAEKRGWEMAKVETESAKADLAKNGMKVLAPSPELKAGLEKVGATMIEEWTKKAGPDGKAIIDAFRK